MEKKRKTKLLHSDKSNKKKKNDERSNPTRQHGNILSLLGKRDTSGGRPTPPTLYAQRGPLLAVALGVLAEDVAQHLGDAVDAQLPADGQRLQQLHGARLPEEGLEGQRDAGEVLGRAHLVELAAVLQGELLAVVHADLSANSTLM